MTLQNVLFVCSKNRLRSPTAEQVFAGHPKVETASAGTNNDAENPLTAELVEWADIIFVMERTHQTKVRQKFKRHLKSTRLVCLNIPDDFGYMDPELIALLEKKVAPYLP